MSNLSNKFDGKDLVAVIIGIAVGTAVNMITFAVLWDALFSNEAGLSDNAAQVLTGWGGGLIGILGAYVGYRVSQSNEPADTMSVEPTRGTTMTDTTSTPEPENGESVVERTQEKIQERVAPGNGDDTEADTETTDAEGNDSQQQPESPSS